MSDSKEKGSINEIQKSKIRARYKGIDAENLDVIPALPQVNFYEDDKEKRVAVYARVSTDDPRQTSSYELQKNHYIDVVNQHLGWNLVDIYADEGISGTSLQHRDAFIRMISDCRAGKINLIVTKSVSRFARNVLDCIGFVRQEIRLENGSYVVKNFWAQLDTVFSISPDPRIVYLDNPGLMESGFGVQATCKTTLTTNYDHPEKLIGPQMVWVYYPESVYGQGQWQNVRDSLETNGGNIGDKAIQWQYIVNLYSETQSRLHYTPLWFPDGQYTALAQAFYAWSPVGQMIDYKTNSVMIDGDMYDRITAVRS